MPITAQCLTEAWGYKVSKEDAHNVLKTACNYREIVNESTGEICRIPETTTKMSTVDAEVYHENCRKWVFEWFGVDIPLPNEQMQLFETQ